MLVLEATVMMIIILSLFRARTILGLTPLYIVLGGFQYLEATLDLQTQVAPGFWLYPASSVLFTTTLVTVLLIYLKEDALEARKLLYGLVLANASVSLVSLVVGWHLQLPGSISTLKSARMLDSARVSMLGTSVLFLDVLGLILVYEFVSRYVSGRFWRLLLPLLVIVAFDQTVFTLMIRGLAPGTMRAILFGLVGKATAVAFYSVISMMYLRFGEPHTATVGTGHVADVFQTLTYRQKYEQARQRMVRDGLTGLYNRGYLDEVLPQALGHAERHGESLSLVMIDTDKFKNINDQLSHADGDAALRLIADVIQSGVRPSDTPCRYGGDEFVVLLSGADEPAAAAFAERFRTKLLERCRTAHPPYPWGLVTTTSGIATVPADGRGLSAEAFIRIADRRLYVGKQAGRDVVITSERERDAPAEWRPVTADSIACTDPPANRDVAVGNQHIMSS